MYLAKKLKVFFIFFLIIFLEAQKSWSLENKILFKVDNEIITTIDIYEEIKFLKTFNPEINNLSETEIFEISKNSILRERIKKIEKCHFSNHKNIVNYLNNHESRSNCCVGALSFQAQNKKRSTRIQFKWSDPYNDIK